ncbi:MAG: 4a-hydroxytetrahydrobiopterin dehydratase [Actinobacteria bacterium]|nr:4a-hydroxytetrahydrobiopterin dehydratase [Actinomycetota bacterium]
MTILTEAEIQDRLTSHPGWEFRTNALIGQFTLPSFMAVIRLVNRIAGAAEAADHHPDIHINFRHITFTLSTRDAGGVTARDFALLQAIEQAAKADGP